jgi:chromosome segregation ATPase
MEYIDLKEKLEKLLTEDLSNRNTLQDTRRNLFLNSEGAKVQQQLVSQKEIEINSLNMLVEKKKTILQLKDDEIETLKNQLKEFQQKLSNTESAHQLEKEEISSKLQDTEELTKLSIQNEEYTAKIRELIYHVDSQNTEIENLKVQLSVKTEIGNKASELEEKTAELKGLSEKLDLISNSERTLKQLVASQNLEIEKHHIELTSIKAQTEEIVAGWQQQQEQLLIDNATLQADFSSLYLQYTELQQSTPIVEEVESVVENIQSEKEHLSSELQAVKHELEVISQQRDEKVVLLQAEISSLQSQIASLQEGILTETEEKQNLSQQLEQLTSVVSQKEEQLNSTSSEKTDDEAFIDKLLSQVNLLNEQKHTFETLYQTTEADLQVATETLTNLTQVIENQKSAIYNLEHTNKNIKLAQTLMLQVKDKTAAKQAINELIREIENCIALLSE